MSNLVDKYTHIKGLSILVCIGHASWCYVQAIQMNDVRNFDIINMAPMSCLYVDNCSGFQPHHTKRHTSTSQDSMAVILAKFLLLKNLIKCANPVNYIFHYGCLTVKIWLSTESLASTINNSNQQCSIFIYSKTLIYQLVPSFTETDMGFLVSHRNSPALSIKTTYFPSSSVCLDVKT